MEYWNWNNSTKLRFFQVFHVFHNFQLCWYCHQLRVHIWDRTKFVCVRTGLEKVPLKKKNIETKIEKGHSWKLNRKKFQNVKNRKNLFVYGDFFLKSGLKRRKKENQIPESKKKKNFLNYVKKQILLIYKTFFL